MYTRLVAIITCFFFSSELICIDSNIKKEIQGAHFDKARKLIKKKYPKSVSLNKLQKLGIKYKANPLLRALSATKKLQSKTKSLGITTSELLQTALYIETHAPTKRTTHLPLVVEHDSKKKHTFIAVDTKKSYVGEGRFKKVYKSILYDSEHPKIVARAMENGPGDRETGLTKAADGLPGVIEVEGFAKHTKKGKKFSTIYSKLYNQGSLHDVLDKGMKLSLNEKMKIALDILQGLASLHGAGIVHKDLGLRNYLVNIKKTKSGKRNIKACIVDLGQSCFIRHANASKVQGNTYYTSPEGLYRDKMKGRDYCKSDVFAVGCIFYQLIHGKRAPWLDFSYVKDEKTPLKKRYKTLTHRIHKTTKARRLYLANKTTLTKMQKFEAIMLRMLSINPAKRGSAQLLHDKVEAHLYPAKNEQGCADGCAI